jgi:hypothetical protein
MKTRNAALPECELHDPVTRDLAVLVAYCTATAARAKIVSNKTSQKKFFLNSFRPGPRQAAYASQLQRMW